MRSIVCAGFELDGYERREIDVTEGGSLDIELEPAMNCPKNIKL